MDAINEQGKPNPPKPGIPALESRLLADRLATIPDGQYPLITYEELNEIAHCNVQGKGRCYLATAREIVLREKGYVFRPERNIGVKRMTKEEISEGCSWEKIEHARRTHKKGIREQATVKVEELDPSKRAGHIARISYMALAVHQARSEQIKKLEAVVNGSLERLPLQKTLEAFKE